MSGASGLDANHGHRSSGYEGVRSETGGVEVERAVSTIGRLKRRADFLAAAGGRRFHTDRMTAQGFLREGGEPPGLRIGFTVTKRVGHAVERNRIKRRLRGVISSASRDLPGTTADVVLIARRPILDASFDMLVQDLRRAVDAVTKPRSARTDSSPNSRPSRAGAGAGPGKPGHGKPGHGKPRGQAPSRPSSDGRTPSPPPNACDGPTDGQ